MNYTRTWQIAPKISVMERSLSSYVSNHSDMYGYNSLHPFRPPHGFKLPVNVHHYALRAWCKIYHRWYDMTYNKEE